MYSKTTLLALLVAVSEARFGQEQGNGAIAAIQAVTSGGASGQAATLAGNSIQFLLAAANPCGKLTQADAIVAQLGTGADSIAAARGLVAAEQNFNPFNVDVPTICSDPTLPTTAALRGIVPLIDPAVGGSALENANSNKSVVTPFANVDGMSVADVMVANGFSNFTTTALDGTKGTPNGAASGSASAGAASSVAASSVAASSAAASAPAADACGAPSTTMVTVTRGAASSTAASSAAPFSNSSASASSVAAGAASSATGTPAPASSNAVTGVNPGFQKSTIAGLDFGLCTPTMKFEAGLNGRADTESTFQAIDPLVNKGQQEALNPNIITNRIKDQLTNVCQANQAAKDAAVAAMAQISALGTRDATTADAWNTALGFAGTNTNPDNAPQAGLVGHT